MGYYTQHELEVTPTDFDINHKGEISRISKYSDCFEDEIKWYSHEKDMRLYSRMYPELLFKLLGEGEENGDLWVEYYKNGKMQRCKAQIVYAEFNEMELE